MLGSDVVSAAAQSVVAVLVLTGEAEVWHLAALNGVRGAATAFFLPAAQGLTPQTVPSAELQEANALLRLTFAGTNIVGAALGGILVAVMVLGAGAMVGLALGLPTWGIALAAVVSGAAFELFGVFWELMLQQHVPRDRLSRVASYDALGSFVAIPLGQLLAGPLAAAVGVTAAVCLAVAVYVSAQVAVLVVPDVRRLERTDIGPPAPTAV